MTIKEFLVSFLMPEKCYQTFFVEFHPHGETFYWEILLWYE